MLSVWIFFYFLYKNREILQSQLNLDVTQITAVIPGCVVSS